ncbi:hypothetical protein [Haloarchaeobius sp. DYHT-AS-18]|uniref:hypothetical protein n=1 Tax=Haloarchaeobius sp. DYHT-AS-18 TaxID=3446117 RepID=UPI003EBBA26D
MPFDDLPDDIASDVEALEQTLSTIESEIPSLGELHDLQAATERVEELTAAYPSVGRRLLDPLVELLRKTVTREPAPSSAVFGIPALSRAIQRNVLGTLSEVDPLTLADAVAAGPVDALVPVLETVVQSGATTTLRVEAAGVLSDVILYAPSPVDVETFDPDTTAAALSDLLGQMEASSVPHRALALLCFVAHEAPGACSEISLSDLVRSLYEADPTAQLWGMLLADTDGVDDPGTDEGRPAVAALSEALLDVANTDSDDPDSEDEWRDVARSVGQGCLVTEHTVLDAVIGTLDERIEHLTRHRTDAELPSPSRQRWASVRGIVTATALGPLPDDALAPLARLTGKQLRRHPDRHEELAWILGLGVSAADRASALDRLSRTARTSTLTEYGGRQLAAQVLGQYLAATPVGQPWVDEDVRERVLADARTARWSLPAQALGDVLVYGDGDIAAAVDTLGTITRHGDAPEGLENRPAADELGVLTTFTAENATIGSDWLSPAIESLTADIERQVERYPGRIPSTPVNALGLLVAYDGCDPASTLDALREETAPAMASIGGVHAVFGYCGSVEEAIGFVVALQDRDRTTNRSDRSLAQSNPLDASTPRRARMAAQAAGIAHVHGDDNPSDAFESLAEPLFPESRGSVEAGPHAYLLGRLVAEHDDLTSTDAVDAIRRVLTEDVDDSSVSYARFLYGRALGTAAAADTWAPDHELVPALADWRRIGDEFEHETDAARAATLLAIHDDHLPAPHLEIGAVLPDVFEEPWGSPGVIEALGHMILETHAEPTGRDAVRAYFDDILRSGSTAYRTSMRAFHIALVASAISPKNGRRILERSLRQWDTPVLEADRDALRWLLRSIALVSKDGTHGSETLATVLRNVLTEDDLDPVLRLVAIDGLSMLPDATRV